MYRIRQLEDALRDALAAESLPTDVQARLAAVLEQRTLTRRARYPHLYTRPCPECGEPMQKQSQRCARCLPPPQRMRHAQAQSPNAIAHRAWWGQAA